MDPTTTLDMIRDALRSGAEDTAADLAHDLLGWLNNGGFPPAGETVESARGMALAAITGR